MRALTFNKVKIIYRSFPRYFCTLLLMTHTFGVELLRTFVHRLREVFAETKKEIKCFPGCIRGLLAVREGFLSYLGCGREGKEVLAAERIGLIVNKRKSVY